ncbi:MAG: N-acetylneuraminate synthase family protein [Jatrophihabitantaceae bacterium]
MNRLRYIGDRPVGPDHRVYISGAIGINHNGNLGDAVALIDAAVDEGCDAVTFQKRTPELCVSLEQQCTEQDTPWGQMSYLAYRHRVEFNADQYGQIVQHCGQRGIAWLAAPLDIPSVDFLELMNPPAHRIAPAALTDDALLGRLREAGRTVIVSTARASIEQIRHAADVLGRSRLILCHTTNASADELDLTMIDTLRREFPDVVVSHCGHEVGHRATLAAVALGASFLERRITLDRASWGSEQAEALDPVDLQRLIREVRALESTLADRAAPSGQFASVA